MKYHSFHPQVKTENKNLLGTSRGFSDIKGSNGGLTRAINMFRLSVDEIWNNDLQLQLEMSGMSRRFLVSTLTSILLGNESTCSLL